MTSTPSTSAVLLDRLARNSRPGERDDPYKVALAIEGGGMRGVVSGGMVSALEVLGLRDAFDVVYGSSSGAMAGAYFVAGQARFGTTIYYQDINNSRFINLLNLFRSEPVMSTGFLLDHVCRVNKPLDVGRVLRGDLPLRIVASSIARRAPVILRDFCGAEDVFDALRASINVPGTAGSPKHFGDDLYLDAAVYESIPFRSARQDGATHVLALMTRPEGKARRPPSLPRRLLMHWMLGDLPRPVLADYLRGHEVYQGELAEIARLEAEPSPGFRLEKVRLAAGCRTVSQLEKDKNVLLNGAIDGFAATLGHFGSTDPRIVEILDCFPAPRLA